MNLDTSSALVKSVATLRRLVRSRIEFGNLTSMVLAATNRCAELCAAFLTDPSIRTTLEPSVIRLICDQGIDDVPEQSWAQSIDAVEWLKLLYCLLVKVGHLMSRDGLSQLFSSTAVKAVVKSTQPSVITALLAVTSLCLTSMKGSLAVSSDLICSNISNEL